MNDRIKLAEAMGWIRSTIGGENCWRHYFTDQVVGSCPDPFSNASDDYQVLVWMRRADIHDNGRFADILLASSMWAYEVGDYARAAMKVIDHE